MTLSRRSITLAVGCLALLLATLATPAMATASPATAAAAGSPGPYPAATERALDQIVHTAMVASGTPGMAAGVWDPARGSYARAFGVANVATGRPLSLSDHVRIASITKTFTATAVLQLVDRHRLRLDDTLSTYVPGIDNGDRITIRQLLDMTAGVYDYTGDPGFNRALDRDPQLAFGPRDALRIIRQHHPAFAPGDRVGYSDSNYVLLGLVVERVTQRSLAQVVTEQILQPLGLRETSYPTTAAMPRPFSRGYVPGADGSLRDVTALNPGIASGAGAMISTLGDLHVWARALARGTLLRPETQRLRLTTQPFPGQALDVRYGLGILEINGFLGHNGAIYGYGSAMFYLPSRDATIVVTSNLSTNSSTIPLTAFFGIANYLYPGRFPQAAAQVGTQEQQVGAQR